MENKPPSLLFEPACSICGKRAVKIEIVPPDSLPQDWNHWKPTDRKFFTKHRDPGEYFFLFEGIERGNGSGDSISEKEARKIVDMLSPTFDFKMVHERFYDDLGYCAECQAFYCSKHWSSDRGGYGHCPKGHGKSLDPHWSPDDYD